VRKDDRPPGVPILVTDLLTILRLNSIHFLSSFLSDCARKAEKRRRQPPLLRPSIPRDAKFATRVYDSDSPGHLRFADTRIVRREAVSTLPPRRSASNTSDRVIRRYFWTESQE
jgi:hypothetical protein